MVGAIKSHIILSVFLTFFSYDSSEAIKCFDCNSANNSACLDLHLQKMHAIIPIVDCELSLRSRLTEDKFFCRKITQTILHVDKTPEVRITRGCGWVKHKRSCYTNDNKDHLETVCQCFGDMCNAAAGIKDVRLSAVATIVAILLILRTYRGDSHI